MDRFDGFSIPTDGSVDWQSILEKMSPSAKELFAKLIRILVAYTEPHNRLEEIYTAPFSVKGFKGDGGDRQEMVMYIAKHPLTGELMICMDTPKNYKRWFRYTCLERKAYVKEEHRQKTLPKSKEDKSSSGKVWGAINSLGSAAAKKVGYEIKSDVQAEDIPKACQAHADHAVSKAMAADDAKTVTKGALKLAWKTAANTVVPVPGLSQIADLLDSLPPLDVLPPLPGFNFFNVPGFDLTGTKVGVSQLQAQLLKSAEDAMVGKFEDALEDESDDVDPEKEAAEALNAEAEAKIEYHQSKFEQFMDFLRQQLLGKDSFHEAVNKLTDDELLKTIREFEEFCTSRRSTALLHNILQDKMPEVTSSAEKMQISKRISGSTMMESSISLKEWTMEPIEEVTEGGRFTQKKMLRVNFSKDKFFCFCFKNGQDNIPLYFYENTRETVKRILEYDLQGNWYYDSVKLPPRVEQAPKQMSMSMAKDIAKDMSVAVKDTAMDKAKVMMSENVSEQLRGTAMELDPDQVNKLGEVAVNAGDKMATTLPGVVQDTKQDE